VSEAVGRIGSVAKYGVKFVTGDSDFANTIYFDNTLEPSPVSTYQVVRSEFDKVLLDHARDCGVTVHEGTAVKRVRMEAGRPAGVDWHSDTGAAGHRTCDFLVDASGRAGVVGAKTGKKRQVHEVFRNVAVWGYWRNAELLPGTPGGGLVAVSCPTGWFWVIPLRDERFSVGFVTHRDHFQERKPHHRSLDQLLASYVSENDDMRQILCEATYLGPARVDTDYSYVTDRFSGPGHIMIGDAACFLDPLLSTGTHMALYSALLGAASVVAALDGSVPETAAIDFFERKYRHVYQRYLSMVSLMYQQYRGKETYFWHAQRLLKDGARRQVSRASFTKLISGMADLGDVGYTHDGKTFTTPQIPISAVSDAQGGLRLVTEPSLRLVPA